MGKCIRVAANCQIASNCPSYPLPPKLRAHFEAVSEADGHGLKSCKGDPSLTLAQDLLSLCAVQLMPAETCRSCSATKTRCWKKRSGRAWMSIVCTSLHVSKFRSPFSTFIWPLGFVHFGFLVAWHDWRPEGSKGLGVQCQVVTLEGPTATEDMINVWNPGHHSVDVGYVNCMQLWKCNDFLTMGSMWEKIRRCKQKLQTDKSKWSFHDQQVQDGAGIDGLMEDTLHFACMPCHCVVQSMWHYSFTLHITSQGCSSLVIEHHSHSVTQLLGIA